MIPYVAALLLVPVVLTAETIETSFFDDFDSVENWTANNPRTPPEFSASEGVLTLIDPPGGEVTWGTSLYRRGAVEVDLDRTPWFVAKLTAMTGAFRITLVNTATNEKRGGLASASKPGYAVCHVPQATGWKGKVRLMVGLYVAGTEKSVSLDWIKFASALTEEEKAAAPKATTARPPLPHHGLEALARRTAWRPLDRFTVNDRMLSERVIYADSVTGNQVWRMTVDPGVDKVAYYDLPEWNANGSRLMFLSLRGGPRLWMMNADGSGIRPMPFPEGLAGSGYADGFWSVRDPNLWWAGQQDEKGSRVIAFNVLTGETEVVAQTTRPGLRLYPPHPKEQYFLLARNAQGEGADCEVVILGRDGSEQVVPIGGRFHRLRFTKHDNLRVFYNRDDPRRQYVIMPDGSDRVELPDPGSHPDWMRDGSALTYFAAGGVWAVNPDATGRRELFHTGSGGHGGPSWDGRFFIADQYGGGDFPMSILYAPTDGSGVVHQLAYHGSVPMSHDDASRAHPDHHSTHPHPSFSPDGTKAVFSSYSDRAYVDLHVAVCRYPDPPRELRAERKGRRVRLQWREPTHSRELQGYAVYRSAESGRGFVQVNGRLSTELSYEETVPTDAPFYYTVVAVENSGLTGLPSNEVCASETGQWEGRFRWCVEAESTDYASPVRRWLDQANQSGGWAIGSATEEPVEVTLPYATPRAAARGALWARERDVPAGGLTGDDEGVVPGWHWVKLEERALTRGPGTTSVSLAYPSRVDKLLVTDDLTFHPDEADNRRLHTRRPALPVRVTAKTLGTHYTEVTWAPSPDPGVRYYNVYAVAAPDAYGTQASLVASTAEPVFRDWGLAPGSTQWYRVTAVDGFGNESEQSTAASATLPPGRLVAVELTPETASHLNAGLDLVEDGGRQVVAQKPGLNGKGCSLGWQVDLPVDGTYAVWVEHKTPGPTTSRGASIRWDGAKDASGFSLYGGFGRFVWWAAQQARTSTPDLFPLAAGKHQLNLALSGEGKEVARVVVSNDPTFMPHRFGEEPASALQREQEPAARIAPAGGVLYEEPFLNLDQWVHEGRGSLTLAEPGTMRLDIRGSKQGGPGSMAFCRRDFPDQIALEYDLKVLSPNGLVITFVALQGLHGEDLFSPALKPRTGVFSDYVGDEADVKSYHVSVSRYNDKGQHTGVSNWRRNPGLHLMTDGPDLCRELNRWYRIRIVKDGPHLQLQVNGQLASEFVDPGTLPTPPPTGGKIGFRAIGADVRALVRNLRVRSLR